MEMKKVITGAAALSGLVALGQTANADEVVVKAGDTVSELALKYNTTINAIQQANKLQDVNLIFVGQRLEVGSNVLAEASQAAQQQQAQPAQAAPQAQTQVQEAQPAQQQTQQVPQTQEERDLEYLKRRLLNDVLESTTVLELGKNIVKTLELITVLDK